MINMVNQPLLINGIEIDNRVVFQPMEGCDGNSDGSIGELTHRRYMRFAESGAGIIWFEAVAVTPEGRANPRQLYISDVTKESFSNLISEMKTRAIELYGKAPIIIAQLTHSGRYARPIDVPAPIVAYRNSIWEAGREGQNYTIAADEYLDTISSKYAVASTLACEVGFDGVDVKCCHGYLFNEFLSAYSREGNYGGSFENRTRLYFDAVSAVKANMPEGKILTTRLNISDCFPYGYGWGVNKDGSINLDETKLIMDKLADQGVEMINFSIGNPYVIPHINRPHNGITPESPETALKRIYNATAELQAYRPSMKIVSSALTYLGEKCMEYAGEMLDKRVCQLVGFGRMTFAYPSFYQDFKNNGFLDKKKCCICCSKCTELMRAGSVSGCPIRDKDTYLPLYMSKVMKK